MKRGRSKTEPNEYRKYWPVLLFLSRHTLWHLRGMARFVRKHPERLRAL